jgi:hypothetical protein
MTGRSSDGAPFSFVKIRTIHGILYDIDLSPK